MKSVLALVCIVSAMGCGSMGGVGQPRFQEMLSAKAKTRAAFDFSCKSDEIVVTAIDDRNFGVTGCGKKATYIAQPAICNPTRLTAEGVNMYCSLVLNSQQ